MDELKKSLVSQTMTEGFMDDPKLRQMDIADLRLGAERLEERRALKDIEPKLDGAWSNQLHDRLRPIGAKIAPTMPKANAKAWIAALKIALSDIDADILVTAAAQAVHSRLTFPNEVEGEIARLAEIETERRRLAAYRLRYLAAELERALNPLPALTVEPHVWTQDEVDGINENFAMLGIATRYRLVGSHVESYQLSPVQHAAAREHLRNTLAGNGGTCGG
jgi:hypothetical protein